MESVQKRFLKFLHWKKNNKSYPPRGSEYELLLKEFDIVSLEDRRIISQATMLFKILHNLSNVPEFLERLPIAVPSFFARRHSPFYLDMPRDFLSGSPVYRMCNALNVVHRHSLVDFDFLAGSLSSLINGLVKYFKEKY